MVNDMRALLHDAAAAPPADDIDLATVLAGGRQRLRRRRARLAGGLAVVVVGTVALGTVVGRDADGRDTPAASAVPRPEGPVVRLADARQAKEGVDYDVVASQTNDNLDAANGRYFDGVTEDGKILFRDGPHGPENSMRYALLDPATGHKDWLPRFPEHQQVFPLELGRDRLVLLTAGNDRGTGLRAWVYDRAARTWASIAWAGLPDEADLSKTEIGPGGRLYVGVPATVGSPPPGGWPTGPDGEADDAGATGETYDLWSVSLTDSTDAREEGLRVGDIAFTDDAMVWSAATNGKNDRIHVRDLATGAEHDFDPHSGARCNLLGFGALDDRIVLSQYCGTYDNGRDDRVQVLTTDGDLVTTLQGNGLDGWVTGGVVRVTAHDPARPGTYVYEPDTGRFARVSDGNSSWGLGGPVPDGYLLWDTPVGTASDPQEPIPGATQWLARWR
ncbi:hypothetical protein [Nocardioides daeguensis]|uniref:WD40 repeat domain-containing protein n=1 Tax=Nocardioides daeguensis TaxID=908359 RepID=A0ABP6V084_9ACTN|nr:hypothetical protein [Nocardioides daeguensis]MBV6726975.1 hypothetical protein [Nocardioides daeguensis]MCR1771621.1 hypothetical protein [Nocardioides daeguensis]